MALKKKNQTKKTVQKIKKQKKTVKPAKKKPAKAVKTVKKKPAKKPASVKAKKSAVKKKIASADSNKTKAAKKSALLLKVKSMTERIKAKRANDLKQPVVAAQTLSDESRNALRKLLVQKREQIVKEAKVEISKYIKGENKQLVDTALDDGDWANVDLSEDVSLRQLGSHREILLKIDSALRKLEEGTYGICEDCGEQISPERLKVLPFAIFCRDCQEKIEQLEAIEKSLH